jgi:hypothetical protein
MFSTKAIAAPVPRMLVGASVPCLLINDRIVKTSVNLALMA